MNPHSAQFQNFEMLVFIYFHRQREFMLYVMWSNAKVQLLHLAIKSGPNQIVDCRMTGASVALEDELMKWKRRSHRVTQI
ncbi:hypothetical protein GBA52_002819 [Prunus armeniaca]|nr:hypothetical protein GBA52_002819 [Prunus armeniaca]